MVSSGVHRNGSMFYITTAACPHLDGRAVAFGRVTEGMDVVAAVTKVYSVRGRPVSSVKVTKAGVLTGGSPEDKPAST
jgi:cyclophilin family peptidyl-prolyl cis-trans isomerase